MPIASVIERSQNKNQWQFIILAECLFNIIFSARCPATGRLLVPPLFVFTKHSVCGLFVGEDGGRRMHVWVCVCVRVCWCVGVYRCVSVWVCVFAITFPMTGAWWRHQSSRWIYISLRRSSVLQHWVDRCRQSVYRVCCPFCCLLSWCRWEVGERKSGVFETRTLASPVPSSLPLPPCSPLKVQRVISWSSCRCPSCLDIDLSRVNCKWNLAQLGIFFPRSHHPVASPPLLQPLQPTFLPPLQHNCYRQQKNASYVWIGVSNCSQFGQCDWQGV